MVEQTASPVSPFTPQQLERAFLPLTETASLDVCEVFAGNINTILKVENGGHLYGLRVRVHESVYRYEPGLIKEVFVLRLLQLENNMPDDAQVASAFQRLCAAQCGTVTDHHERFPRIRYFDWSKRSFPHPYCIYDWVDGTPLLDFPTSELYRQAGQALSLIHQVRFTAFYPDFLSIGVAPVIWNERYRAALTKERAAARAYLRQRVDDALDSLSIPLEAPCAPCLVHNDFAPGNIVVRDGQIVAVIDWDNAVVEAPHLDFVKMKYWTARNSAGELSYDPELFAAFVDGYGSTGQEIIDSPLFLLYEILWLLRVFNFERSKELQGLARAPGYPAAAEYEKLLARMLS